jgi:serine/threonine protein kinase/tetratricopeptide (TPR) repeat protein
MTLENGSIINQYKILSPIGEGGMGEVFLAQDTKLDRKVALKILPSEFADDSDRMSRFVREAKSASSLNHPNIITIHEISESNGTHFITTEFIDGKTLNEYKQANPLDYKSALEIAIQVASALDEAHHAGIVHRDIKPDNVMVRSNGLAKLLDFGIAKVSASSTSASDSSEDATAIKGGTSPGMIIGTANYMSPEQAKGKEVDARTDIFSFGVVLYEMIAGHLPFAGENALEMIGSILHKEPKPLNSEVPTEITKIINKCLRKNRDERYQTIKDVLIDLKDVKQDLEFQDKLERSIVPDRDGNKTQILQATTLNERHQATTNQTVASYPGKKYFAAGLMILLLAAGGFFGYKYFAPTDKQINSIAVLPFENRSGNPDSEYLADGLAESLIYRLSQLPNLKVSPTSSVFRYKGKETDGQRIADELGVDAVMTGRMTQRGEQLTISVELVDVRNNRLLWGEQYERKMSELLQTQREIAAAITQKLQLKLSGGESGLTKKYTDNNEAYQLYLKARFHFAKRTKEDILRSIEIFRQAIALDPNFALAHVGVAESFAVMPSYPYMSPAEAMPQSKAAIAKALEIDPELAEAHTVAGMNAATYDWDWTTAEREFKKAIELDPNLAVAHYRYAWVYLSPMGRHAEAIAEMKRAMALEPLALTQGANYAAVLLYAREFDPALEQAKKTYDLDPNHPAGRSWMCHILNTKEMYSESFLISEKTLQTDSPMLAQAAFAYAKSGQRQKALEIIKRWKEGEKTKYVMNYWVAVVYAALGERDAAFAELEKSYQARDWFLQRLKTDPFMDNLRDDPRFNDLVKRIGLP